VDFCFPKQFPQDARKAVVSAWLSAEHDLEQARAAARDEFTGERVLSAFYCAILRVVLVFARQLFELVKQGVVTMDRVDSEVYEFRRRLTIEAWYEQGYDQDKVKLSDVANYRGSLRPEVDRAFREMPEWHQYKEEFRAFAQALVQPSAVAAGNSASTVEGGPAGSPPAAKANKTPRPQPRFGDQSKAHRATECPHI